VFAQRIESAQTGVGVPDLYVRLWTREVWLELKNMPKTLRMSVKSWRVMWRPGQQGWFMDYRRACGMCGYTICALREGFIAIVMKKLFPNNHVEDAVDIVTRLDTIDDVAEYIISKGK
jgi:hypothetical protein